MFLVYCLSTHFRIISSKRTGIFVLLNDIFQIPTIASHTVDTDKYLLNE